MGAVVGPDGEWTVELRWVGDDDLVVLVLIAFGAFLLRVCFGRPWIVKARSPDGDVYTWRIVGWDKARRRKSTVGTAIAAGRFPPPVAGGGFAIEPVNPA